MTSAKRFPDIVDPNAKDCGSPYNRFALFPQLFRNEFQNHPRHLAPRSHSKPALDLPRLQLRQAKLAHEILL